MDIRDLSWKVRPAGNTLLAEIEKLAEKVKVPASKRKDLKWLSQNLRGNIAKNEDLRCESLVLLSYVDHALQQGINFGG
jgi:hypothetical protein